MQFGQTISCDICNADMMDADGKYTIDTAKRKEDGDVILIRSICCPVCGARYPFSITNKALRKKIRKRKSHIDSIVYKVETEGLTASDAKIREMLARNRQMAEEIRKGMADLRSRYLGTDTVNDGEH